MRNYIFENIVFFEFIANMDSMNERSDTRALRGDLTAALSSPQRLELIGLYVEDVPLSVSDMAQRLGRPATSLYHHVRVLLEAGVLKASGTRPKGKRFETLYELTRDRLELDLEDAGEEQMDRAAQAMSTALRMAGRDFVAAMKRDDLVLEGAERNLAGYRMHMRVDAQGLARVNAILEQLENLAAEAAAAGYEPGPDAQFISITLAVSPLRGRRIPFAAGGNPTEESP